MNGVPLNIDFRQIILHLFNFAVLFTCLYFILYKPVKKFMDKREKIYKDREDETNKNLLESKSLKEEYDEKLAEFEKEQKKKIKESNLEIEKLKNEEILKAKEEAKEIILKAKKEAEKEKEKIIESSGKEISEMVSSALEKIDTEDSFDEFLKLTKEK